MLRLAAIEYDRGFDIDLLLAGVCGELTNRGLRLGGLLQVATGGKGGCATSVRLQDLRSAMNVDIWESRGACARGCRLNEAGLLNTAPIIDAAIADRVDLLVINRFGRAESLGRGLLDYFVRALEADIPVLTAVRAPYDEAWSRFNAGLGFNLGCNQTAVIDWVWHYARQTVDDSRPRSRAPTVTTDTAPL